jgi:pimeloyl-ACP methyl ester carboxylesterase
MRIDNRGIGLEVDIDGPPDGPPVVLLHGISSCAATYDFLVPELPAHRLVRLDFRGHGRSDRAPGHYTVDDYASDAVAVIEQLVGRPTVVIGHSLGGITAAHVAQHRPELITGMLLEDPPLFFGDKATFDATPFAVVFPLIRAAIDQWHADGVDAAGIAAAVAGTPSMTGQGTMGEENEPDALAAFGTGFAALDTSVYDPVLDGVALGGFDVARPIAVPGVLLQPDRDLGAAFFDEHAATLAATSPKLEIVRMRGVGHLIHDSRTHRAAYLDEVRRFLDTYAPA